MEGRSLALCANRHCRPERERKWKYNRKQRKARSVLTVCLRQGDNPNSKFAELRPDKDPRTVTKEHAGRIVVASANVGEERSLALYTNALTSCPHEVIEFTNTQG